MCGHQHTRDVKNSTYICDTYFNEKCKLTMSNLLVEFDLLVLTDDDLENNDDKLKLALLLFLEIVVLSKENNNTFDNTHILMVNDLEYFNAYPWGTVSFRTTIKSLYASFDHKGDITNTFHTYSLVGFLTVFLVSYL